VLSLVGCKGGVTPVTSDDMSLGNAGAKVTVIEYASASCPHCAHFNNEVFPAFKAKYIDTGKVHYVFREFLTAPRPEAPACLVLDIRLPDVSGLEFQRELAEANIDLPIIFITGHADIPRENEIDHLAEAEAVFAPPQPKKVKAKKATTKKTAPIKTKTAKKKTAKKLAA